MPVRALSVAFMVLLAVTVTMAVQVVGTLLLFALVVTPAATAIAVTARPAVVAAVATAVALASVWLGLVLVGDVQPAAELPDREPRVRRLARHAGAHARLEEVGASVRSGPGSPSPRRSRQRHCLTSTPRRAGLDGPITAATKSRGRPRSGRRRPRRTAASPG